MYMHVYYRHAGELEEERPIQEGADLGKQRKAAMQRVLTHQRASQERAKEDHRQHLEKRMKAILSLKENIAASEVWRWRGGGGVSDSDKGRIQDFRVCPCV